MDAISKTLDSVVSLVGQAFHRTSYYRRHLISESLSSDNKIAKTMLNDCEFALADNRSKDLFGNKFEEEICRSSKTKTKSTDVFKGIASSNRLICGNPLPSLNGRERGNRGFAFSFKVLNLTRGKKFVSSTSQNLAVLQGLPQFHPLVRSLFPEDLQCRYRLAGRLKYFLKNFEKPSSDQAVLNMISGYKIPFSEAPCQSKYPRQVLTSWEQSLLVDIEIQTLLEKVAIKMVNSNQENI